MKILGIDPGTATTGYSLIEYNADMPILLEASAFETLPEFSLPDRLLTLHGLIDEKIKETNPDCLVIEKLFFNTNIKTAIAVGQARGVLLMAAAKHKLEIFEYTALQAKLVVTGYGRSTKKEVQEAVKNYFNLEKVIKPDDASDAVAITLCHIHKVLKNDE
jgi:crossover junction endodeoxyribonuclease RuvC